MERIKKRCLGIQGGRVEERKTSAKDLTQRARRKKHRARREEVESEPLKSGTTATECGRSGCKLSAVSLSGFYEGFEFDLAVHGFDHVFHVFAVFLLLQFFGFLQHELIEAGA